MIGAPGETVLPRRVRPQPSPALVPGGDCGACVLGGALDLDVARVYADIKGKVESVSFWEMQRMLRVAAMNGLADRIIEEPAEWRSVSGLAHAAFGRPAYFESLSWFNYVRMAVDAGYYGLAMVNHARQGVESHGTDHWVLICGARCAELRSGDTITGDVLVSCSARGGSEEWVEARDFLKNRGGYNLLLVRPAA